MLGLACDNDRGNLIANFSAKTAYEFQINAKRRAHPGESGVRKGVLMPSIILRIIAGDCP
jgi:hypothetical protein